MVLKRETLPVIIALGVSLPLCLLFAHVVVAAERGRRQAPLRALLGDQAFEALSSGRRTDYHYLGDNLLAPDFTLADQQGSPWRLSDHRGRLVVMNFWSITCQPCVEEVPSLERLARHVERRGDIEVVAVSIDQGWDRVAAIMPPNPRLRVLFDPKKEVVSGKYGTRLYPETWIIDARGVIRFRLDGPRDWSDPLSLNVIELFL